MLIDMVDEPHERLRRVRSGVWTLVVLALVPLVIYAIYAAKRGVSWRGLVASLSWVAMVGGAAAALPLGDDDGD